MIAALRAPHRVREFHILNLGAGVQSTTLALMAARESIPEQLPRLDAAIFADTQEEPRAVYEHLEWLRAQVPFPIIVRTRGKLGDDLVNGINSGGQRFVSIPAFTTDVEGGKNPGLTKRQCTAEYKTTIIERAIRRDVLKSEPRQRIPKDVTVHRYFGLSYDEPKRIFGRNGRPGVKARIEANPRVRAHFPLYDLYLTRGMCIAWLKDKVPHVTPRSACSFCPFHDNAEWLRLKQSDPESWARAVEVDRAIRDHDSGCAKGYTNLLFLHRSCLPLDRVDLTLPDEKPSQQDLNFSALECEGMCGV